jgi:hypothetical protein
MRFLIKSRDQLIEYRRGQVTIPNRTGIEKRAHECSAVSKQEFDHLLGNPLGSIDNAISELPYGIGSWMMNTHRTVLAIFATALVIAAIAAFMTTLHNVDTRSVSFEAPPGTIGLARPHPPLPPAHTGQNW